MARCRLSLRYLGENPPTLHHIQIDVSDDGPGFAWEAHLESTAPEVLVPYGRGIPMMQALAPDFQFNEAGNSVHFSVVC